MAVRLCVLEVTFPYSGATVGEDTQPPPSTSAAVNFISPILLLSVGLWNAVYI